MINFIGLVVLVILVIVLIYVIIKTCVCHSKNKDLNDKVLYQFASSIQSNSEKIKKNRENFEVKNKDIIKNMTIMLGGKTDEFNRHNH